MPVHRYSTIATIWPDVDGMRTLVFVVGRHEGFAHLLSHCVSFGALRKQRVSRPIREWTLGLGFGARKHMTVIGLKFIRRIYIA